MRRFFSSVWLALFASCVLAGAAHASSGWWNDAVGYEIFVRSFQDTNGDGIGDFNGVTARLDYLSGLGVSALWLMPIFQSPSYHGYDISDYMAVNPRYGTLSDFDNLVAQAHRRGMRVILDIALNHTSVSHPWFQASASTTNPSAPFRNWYLWSPEPQDWPGPGRWYPRNGWWYYAVFSRGLPDLNLWLPEVRNELKKALRFWISRGVDGFRLDGARWYVDRHGEPDTPETYQFIQELKEAFPGTFFVGEIWADSGVIGSYVNGGTGLDSAFGFPVSFSLFSSLREENGVPFGHTLADAVIKVRQDSWSPFNTNHDLVRGATQLGLDAAKIKMAATATLTLPGIPFLYYGEEIGMTNGQQSLFATDVGKRTPMQWTTAPNHGFTPPGVTPWCRTFSSNDPAITVQAQLGQADSILIHYKKLIDLRRRYTVLRRGRLESVPVTTNVAASAFLRRLDDEVALVVFNFSEEAISSIDMSFAFPSGPFDRVESQTLTGNASFKVQKSGGRLLVSAQKVQPKSAAIVRLFRR